MLRSCGGGEEKSSPYSLRLVPREAKPPANLTTNFFPSESLSFVCRRGVQLNVTAPLFQMTSKSQPPRKSLAIVGVVAAAAIGVGLASYFVLTRALVVKDEDDSDEKEQLTRQRSSSRKKLRANPRFSLEEVPSTLVTVDAGKSPPHIVVLESPDLPGQNKWLGGACSWDGRFVYGVPGGARKVLRIETATVGFGHVPPPPFTFTPSLAHSLARIIYLSGRAVGQGRRGRWAISGAVQVAPWCDHT